jgi:hypothetical protein
VRDLQIKQDLLQHNQHIINKSMPRILVIATGGTFACVQTPNGYTPAKGIINRLRLYRSLYDEDFTKEYAQHDDENITPVTPFNKRILYKVLEFEEFLDSSCMDIYDQLSIAKMIK